MDTEPIDRHHAPPQAGWILRYLQPEKAIGRPSPVLITGTSGRGAPPIWYALRPRGHLPEHLLELSPIDIEAMERVRADEYRQLRAELWPLATTEMAP